MSLSQLPVLGPEVERKAVPAYPSGRSVLIWDLDIQQCVLGESESLPPVIFGEWVGIAQLDQVNVRLTSEAV